MRAGANRVDLYTWCMSMSTASYCCYYELYCQ